MKRKTFILEPVKDTHTHMPFSPPRISVNPNALGAVTFVLVQGSSGQKKGGPELAPPLVVSDPFLSSVRKLGWKASVEVVEGATEQPAQWVNEAAPLGGNLYQGEEVARVNELVERACDKARGGQAQSSLPIVVGGDHALVMGSILSSAKAHPNVCVIWFDAHADINTPFNSPSGNIHGMPLGFLTGQPGTEKFPRLHHFKCLSINKLGYIGLRSIDEGEKKLFAENPLVPVFTMDEVNSLGLDECLTRLLNRINPDRSLPVHLSFDVDGMDPSEAPSTGTRESGGILLHEALAMIRRIRNECRVVGVDVMEVNPKIGSKDDVAVTVRNAQMVVAESLGRMISAGPAKL